MDGCSTLWECTGSLLGRLELEWEQVNLGMFQLFGFTKSGLLTFGGFLKFVVQFYFAYLYFLMFLTCQNIYSLSKSLVSYQSSQFYIFQLYQQRHLSNHYCKYSLDSIPETYISASLVTFLATTFLQYFSHSSILSSIRLLTILWQTLPVLFSATLMLNYEISSICNQTCEMYYFFTCLRQQFLIHSFSIDYCLLVRISTSVLQHIRYFNAYILPYPDFKNGLPFTSMVFILFNFDSFSICLPSVMWLWARLMTYRLGNCFMFSTLTIALWDRSSYFIDCKVEECMLQSLSILVMPLPKKDKRQDVIRWLVLQQEDSGYFYVSFQLFFIMFCADLVNLCQYSILSIVLIIINIIIKIYLL